MSPPQDTAPTTGALLLAALREHAGDPALRFAGDPAPLAGGFYAEMLRFRLADPPAGLAGPLVARIVPSADAGAWEATVQGHVAAQGFPTPSIRLTAPPTNPLGRFLIVMDHVDGRPPMDGLGASGLLTQLPRLFHGLPDRLAGLAARLHALDPAPLATSLAALDTSFPGTTAGFVEQLVTFATAANRPDLATAGERVLRSQPSPAREVVTHGDLHPFNVLVTPRGPVLIDWTVARVADPAFTVAFTDLMLRHPPLAVPRAAAVPLRVLGRRLADRFLTTYRSLTAGTAGEIDPTGLEWHQRVHALRILVEAAGWATDGRPVPAGHPWVVMTPMAERLLALGS